jgi:hypothetical protein
MSDAEPSYRRRNIALAVIAAVIVVGAIVRMTLTAESKPAEAPVSRPTSQTATQPDTAPASAAHANAGLPIDVEVTYSGAVDALPGTAKVYLFVRPVGERMPLGVQTFGAHDFPLEVAFTPTDSTAKAQTVEVVARLSMSGAVSLQPGDLESVSAPLQFGTVTQNVRLTLGSAPSKATPAAATAAAPADAVRVTVRVSIGTNVNLPATTPVFVIVRPSDGTPMPLAVKRLALSELPADVSLSDSDAMMPGRSISGAGSVEVVARASVSGSAKPEPGDFEARSGVLHVTDLIAPIALVIDKPL